MVKNEDECSLLLFASNLLDDFDCSLINDVEKGERKREKRSSIKKAYQY